MSTPDKSHASHGQIILKWWISAVGDRTSGHAKALAARLRRADRLQALAEYDVHVLARQLNIQQASPHNVAALLRIVRVLAWVREHMPATTLAQRLGQGAPPALSASRFERLMRAEDEELVAALRRALALADGRCNVAALGQDLLRWNDGTRTRWAFHYFGAQAPIGDAASASVMPSDSPPDSPFAEEPQP